MKGGVYNKELIYPELSYKIIGILFDINNELGSGLKEIHYQRAIEAAFNKNGIHYVSQCPYKIRYRGVIVGRYFMDFVVEGRLVIEIKKGDYFSRNNINQLYGYLVATEIKLGLLVNFTSKGLRYKRIVNMY